MNKARCQKDLTLVKLTDHKWRQQIIVPANCDSTRVLTLPFYLTKESYQIQPAFGELVIKVQQTCVSTY